MTQSNLAGVGPDSGAEWMRYEGIGKVDGASFDMVVEATSDYNAHNNSENGFECGLPAQGCKTGRFAQINVAANTSVDLKISFQDTADQSPRTLNRFLFSVHDIDQDGAGTTHEIIYIDGFEDEPIVANTTDVLVSEEDGRTKLSSRVAGTSCDDPSNPMDLVKKSCSGKTIDQKTRSAAFVFANTDSISLTLEVTCSGCASGSSRSFLFTGDTNLLSCPENPTR
jgi:hypothetical protein